MIGVTGSSMESMIYFTLASAMVTALAQIMNIIVGDFREKAISLLSYNPNNKNDPRNMIRKCPHCN